MSKTFNQLFARHVKPGMRPIAALYDDTVIVSAADSTFVGQWEINEESKITVKDIQWSVLELLEGSPYRDRFKGGIFTHSFLNRPIITACMCLLGGPSWNRA